MEDIENFAILALFLGAFIALLYGIERLFKSAPVKNFMDAGRRSRIGFAFKYPVVTLVILGALAVYAFQILHPPTPPTAQEVQAEQAAARERAAADAAKLEQDKYFCRLEPVCEKYGKVRQECATAGNFANCIKVKMGDDDAGQIDACTDDGKIAYPPEHMPDFVRCWVLRNVK